VAEKHMDFVDEYFSQLLSSAKFWKYTKHAHTPVCSYQRS
jgi:hypothetical protein